MCGIISWKGQLPAGLLSKLLIKSQTRGKDSTGIAYRDERNKQTLIYKHTTPARAFVKANNKECGEARRSLLGIGHTRRASPNTPIITETAHPFTYGRLVYAHNGIVREWKRIRSELVPYYERVAQGKYEDPKMSEVEALRAVKALKKAQTDSMILGVCLQVRDFSLCKGAIAMVWIDRDKTYAFRTAKELSAATITWGKNSVSTITASTDKIIEDAVSECEGCGVDAYYQLDEGIFYEIQQDGVHEVCPVDVHPENEPDPYTSGD